MTSVKWQPGTDLNSPNFETVAIDPGQIDTHQMYKLLIGGIVPRPIAWVSTRSATGVVNLAPFSFFNGVSSNPPCLTVSIARKADGSKKDTLINIEETGQFVVNTVSSWAVEPMVFTASPFERGQDELQLAGLSAADSLIVKAPRVKESPINFECNLHQIVEIGDGSPGSAALVIGRIIMVHVAKQAYERGRIDVDFIDPVGRLGGSEYSLLGERFTLQIPAIS